MKELQLDFSNFPVLHTERLDLVQLTMEDAEDLHVLRANANLMRYIPRKKSESVEDAIKLIEQSFELLKTGEFITWALKLKGEKRLIGTFGFYRIQKENHRGEVGYLLHSDFHGKGIADEALKCVLKFGFEKIGFHSIEAVTDPKNISSRKLLEKNNFIQEGNFKENCYFEGQYLDSVVYSLLERDWIEK